MKKAIMTRPNQPTRHVDLTPDEIKKRENEQSNYELERPALEKQAEIETLENSVTKRMLRDAVLGNAVPLQAIEDEIAILRQGL